MRRPRVLRAPAVLLGCLCALLLLGGTPAYAHTALQDATPAPGAKIGSGTSVVELTFAGLQSGSTPEIGLTGSDGTEVPVGQPVVADDSVVCAAVTPLSAGVTTLTYTVTATDGDTQTNAFQFEVVDGSGTATTPSACRGLDLAAPGEEPRDTLLGLDRLTGLLVLAVMVAIVVGVGFFAVRMLRGGTDPEEGNTLI